MKNSQNILKYLKNRRDATLAASSRVGNINQTSQMEGLYPEFNDVMNKNSSTDEPIRIDQVMPSGNPNFITSVGSATRNFLTSNKLTSPLRGHGASMQNSPWSGALTGALGAGLLGAGAGAIAGLFSDDKDAIRRRARNFGLIGAGAGGLASFLLANKMKNNRTLS